jgi:hypothetical protein
MKASRKLKLFLCLIAACALWFSPSSRAGTFGLNPTGDAFVTTGSGNSLVNSNYGGAGALGVAAPGLAQGEFQSVMLFNLAGAMSSFNSQFGAGQWTVQSVTLRVNATPANNAIFNALNAGQFGISLMQNNSWTEGSGTPAAPGATGVTFSSLQPLINGAVDQNLGTFSYSGASSGANTYTLNLTSSLVADILAGGAASFRFYAADSGISYLFNSRSGPAANMPLLTITAAPEPGVAALSATALALFSAARFFGRRMAK